MAEMGLTPTNRWHLLGRHACHHLDSTEIVETRTFDELALTHPEWGTLGVPSDGGGPDAKWCSHCKGTIEDMRSRRYDVIVFLKRHVPYRDVSWETVDSNDDCTWCGKASSVTRYNDDLDEKVCPACARKYNSPSIEVRTPPETDLRQETPNSEVDPIRCTYSSGEAESSDREQARQRAAEERRPYAEVKMKQKYADVVCDIGGTGHRFTPTAVEEIEALQAEQRKKADADQDHKSHVGTDIHPAGTHVQTRSLLPDEAKRHAADLAEIAADPENWQ
ncbi:hypothetical protein ACYJ1Y_15135 [Natrialbaceae archaeon A-gly3]